MNRPLYLNNDYITTLNQLRSIIMNITTIDLENDILAAFRDGLIEDWLDKRDEDCEQLLSQLRKLDKDAPDNFLISELKRIFSSGENYEPFTNNHRRYSDYCRLEGFYYTQDFENDNTPINYHIINTDTQLIPFDKRKSNISFKMLIRIVNPINETLKLACRLNKSCEFEGGEKTISLYAKQNTVVITEFILKDWCIRCPIIFTFNFSVNEHEIRKFLPHFYLSNGVLSPIFSDKATLEQKEAIQQLYESLVLIKGGTFTMGDTQEQSSMAKPHPVTLSDYYLSNILVTETLWEAVMGSHPSYLELPGMVEGILHNAKTLYLGDRIIIIKKGVPVRYISWNQCIDFIRKLNQLIKGDNPFCFPTEAQWEYAARGGNKSKNYIYSGSNDIDAVGWNDPPTDSHIHRICEKEPNELGIYDMSGNVFEWCQDWYAEYETDLQTNPDGPSKGTHRILRGGSYCSSTQSCSVWFRASQDPKEKNSVTSLRLAFNIK